MNLTIATALHCAIVGMSHGQRRPRVQTDRSWSCEQSLQCPARDPPIYLNSPGGWGSLMVDATALANADCGGAAGCPEDCRDLINHSWSAQQDGIQKIL